MSADCVARCLRCNGVLRRTRHDSLTRALALNIAGLGLLAISCLAHLMRVGTFGMYHSATIFSGPRGLNRHGVWELALVVIFMTVLAPLLRLLLITYVLAGLRLPRPPVHLRLAFRWAERIRPWAMIEVYLLAVFVAYSEIPNLVQIEIGVAVYALITLMLVIVASDAVLDRQEVWEEMERCGIPALRVDHEAVAVLGPVGGAVACDSCGLVSLPAHGERAYCPRCGARLEARKPDSVARTWALVIAAAILYVPANVFPVLTFIQFGSGAPSTIIGGARELLNAGLWPLALLVFLASITVPCLKLVGLTFMLVTTQIGSTRQLRERTVLYRIVNTIGRWSMIDIFMESILIALVQFGAVVTIDPGYGAIAFAAVVIITMFGAEMFDPRLMWDAARITREIAESA